jgi:formylglycine-generating enzyme required for sulfatase activity
MGSPRSDVDRYPDEREHTVVIAHGFWLDATEVTNARYQRFVVSNPSYQKGQIDPAQHDGDYLKDWDGASPPSRKAQHPVVWVSWHVARAYCRWAGKRLPTEAEWEYAARAEMMTRFWWGNDFDRGRANNASATREVGDPERTNPWGLSDMLGNVWEWTSSKYVAYPYRSDDGREDPNGVVARVTRGGSWNRNPRFLRTSNRGWIDPVTTSSLTGFRCAR